MFWPSPNIWMISAKTSSFLCSTPEDWGPWGLTTTLSTFRVSNVANVLTFLIFREYKLRVIRPFVYVREKYLRQFVSNQNLPVSSNIISPDLTKERQRIKQVLTQQEILFPKLFTSLRSALHPLIGFQIKECEVKYRRRLKSKDNDDCSENETDEEPVVSGDSTC